MTTNQSNLNQTVFSCGKCNRPDHDESNMVFCDNCQHWFHFGCQGVTSAVKDDNSWICIMCSENSKADGSQVDELANAAKMLAVEKELHKKELQKRMELARMKQKLEIEKREMEWAFEKQELQMRIQAEEAFNRKIQFEKEQLQQQLSKVLEEREKLNQTVVDAESDCPERNNKAKQDSINPRIFCGGKPGTSTPKDVINRRSTRKQITSERLEKETGSDEDIGLPRSVHRESSSDDSISEEEDEREQNIDEITPKPPTNAQLSAQKFLSHKLPTFSGRLEDWPLFYSSYKTTTKACGFSNLENLARLQECLSGPAREAVCSRLLLPEAVPQVIDTLRMLYGRPEQLLGMLLRKVRKAEPPNSERLSSFIGFGMVVQQLSDHLIATNMRDHLVNPMLIQELVDKLPSATKLEWIRYKRQQNKVSLCTLAEFLSEIVSAANEATTFLDTFQSHSRLGKNSTVGYIKNKEKEGYTHVHSDIENKTYSPPKQLNRIPCPMCNKIDHRLRNCEEFRKIDPNERLEAVNQWDLCHQCLNDHGTSRCKLNIRCRVDNCDEQHNKLLHQRNRIARSNCNTHTEVGGYQPILFRIVAVTLYHGNKSINTMAFLDEGSSYTLIDSSLTDQLNIKGCTQPLRVTWTAGVSRLERNSQRLPITLSARGSPEKFDIKNAHTVKELKLPEQTTQFAQVAKQYRHLQNLPIVDYPKESPKILIGLKHLHLFAPLESRIGSPGEPIAVRSKLGWAVYGPQDSGVDIRQQFVGHHFCSGVSNQELHDLIKTHYMTEETGVSVDLLPESAEDRKAREILENTTVRVGDRFQTGLLWRKENPEFPNSYPMATHRMRCLEKRLARNPELKANVETQITEYQEKGYCHKVTEQELAGTDPKKVWYLPLNIVLNPKKPGKVRLVWDAAATVEGVSLNSKLLKGPDFLTSLPSVIFKFREHSVGFGGDIREMFHQVLIQSSDKQAQRFLFAGETYVMDCAIFGATCSPSQALYVKDKNASDFVSQFPKASEAVVKKTYMDDYFDSAPSEEEAITRAKEVRFINSRAGYEVRNWVSNSINVLHQLGEKEVGKQVHFHRDKESDYERVLGIVWNTFDDVFSFSTKMRDDRVRRDKANKAFSSQLCDEFV